MGAASEFLYIYIFQPKYISTFLHKYANHFTCSLKFEKLFSVLDCPGLGPYVNLCAMYLCITKDKYHFPRATCP